MGLPDNIRDKLKALSTAEINKFAVLIVRPGTKAGVMVGPFKSREACREWVDSMYDRYPNAMEEAEVNVADFVTSTELDKMLEAGERLIRGMDLQ